MDEPQNQRAPMTVWRYVMAELWRLLLLTAWVFVSVIAFAATIKPLAEGKLGVLDALKFMTLAMPPMLAYALPFASGFAATLAYHRMAQDNEVVACQAGGVSHRMVLMPALLSGIVLAGFLFVLSNSIIPRFLRSMEELITVDAARFLVNTIDRGEPVQVGDNLIYADLVIQKEPPEGTEYMQVLILRGLLVVQLDDDGQVVTEISARQANAWISKSGDGQTSVTVDLQDYAARGEQELLKGGMLYRFEIPNTFSDDPKFLTWSELNELRKRPEGMNWVDRRRRALASALAQRHVLEALDHAFVSRGVVELIDTRQTGAADRAVRVYASALGLWEPDDGHRLHPPSPALEDAEAGVPFLVERTLASGQPQTMRARQIWLDASPAPEDASNPVKIRILLRSYTAMPDLTAEVGGTVRKKEKPLTDHVLADDPAPAVFQLPTSELLAQADARVEANEWDTFVAGPRDDLRRTVQRLRREIASKQQERIANSAACLMMVLTGAVMALRLRDRSPLVVYLWSFFPALAAVLTVSAGQQAIHDYGMIGLPVMWSGVVGLAAYTFVEFRRLARH